MPTSELELSVCFLCPRGPVLHRGLKLGQHPCRIWGSACSPCRGDGDLSEPQAFSTCFQNFQRGSDSPECEMRSEPGLSGCLFWAGQGAPASCGPCPSCAARSPGWQPLLGRVESTGQQVCALSLASGHISMDTGVSAGSLGLELGLWPMALDGMQLTLRVGSRGFSTLAFEDRGQAEGSSCCAAWEAGRG